MVVVLEKASWSKETASKRTRPLGALDVEGELDTSIWRETVTRWKREFSAISHRVWQTMVAVSYHGREPLRPFRRFLMEVRWPQQVRVLPTSGSCCVALPTLTGEWFR